MKKLILLFILFLPYLLFSQSITLNSVEMHGDGGTSDQDVVSGETVSVSVNHTSSSEVLIIPLNGVHNTATSGGAGKISIYCYSSTTPSASTNIGTVSVSISNYSGGGTGSGKTTTFDFEIPETLNSSTKSIQIMFGFYGYDDEATLFYGTRYQSYITDTYSVCVSAGSPTSGWYEYLCYDADTETEAPTLDSPTANQTVGQNFNVQYDQPEDAYTNTVKLTLTRTAGSADTNSPHVLIVDDEDSGTNKTLSINGGNLGGSSGVSVESGGNVLVDDAVYTVKIEYKDEAQNPVASDENSGVTYDTSGLLLVSGGDYNIDQSFAPDSDNNAFFIVELQKSASGADATVYEIEFDITGSFNNSDVDAIKIWRSENNTFDSSNDTHLLTDSTAPFDPFVAEFDPDQSVGTDEVYYFLTVDVSSTATGQDQIGAEIDSAGDIDTDINISGTFPISGDDHPLPVTLSSFIAHLEGRIPVLKWVTQSETNNAYWNIYRSLTSNPAQADHLNADELIAGQGNSAIPTEYIYEDKNPVESNTTYWYWLESVEYNGFTELYGPVAVTISYDGGTVLPEIPIQYGLHQNFPNPFNPSTQISFILPYESQVELSVYNIKGEKVKTIYEDRAEAEIQYEVVWDGRNSTGRNMPTGLYIFQLKTEDEKFYRKMNLIK